MKYDFCGYVTRNNIKCSDGRTIRKNAFQDCDGNVVPLCWQHMHNEPDNVLGHAILENRDDGVFGYCSFNDSAKASQAKELVKHGDVKALSIYANELVQNSAKDVLHGTIREVSLVLAGANPGAFIENVSFQHGDSSFISEEDAIIHFYMEDEECITMQEVVNDSNSLQHTDDPQSGDKTLGEVMNTFNEDQLKALYFIVEQVRQGGGEMQQSDDFEGGYYAMKHNIFEDGGADEGFVLSHDAMVEILEDAKRLGSLKESVLQHGEDYGITNIEMLFPDAYNVDKTPQWIARDDEWVSAWLSGTSHSPFSRIKTMFADITEDTARAKGYIKGNKKKEEFFSLAKRETTPTTVYKKQKLDRDDIVDITDFDVVQWILGEMRRMLNYELARAGLIGDGRETSDPDKIDETHIRPVYSMEDLFNEKVTLSSDTVGDSTVEEISRAGSKRKGGSGKPNLYTTEEYHKDMLWTKDLNKRRIYDTEEQLCSALGVSKVVDVQDMENLQLNGQSVKGIIVNPADYTYGSTKGGQLFNAEDFDIDYNQYKYLLEGRCCGTLTKWKSAVTLLAPASSSNTEEEPEG